MEDEDLCENAKEIAVINANRYPLYYYKGFTESDMESEEPFLNTDQFDLVNEQGRDHETARVKASLEATGTSAPKYENFMIHQDRVYFLSKPDEPEAHAGGTGDSLTHLLRDVRNKRTDSSSEAICSTSRTLYKSDGSTGGAKYFPFGYGWARIYSGPFR